MSDMPWEAHEDDWFPLPKKSNVPQKASKTNFKACGFYVFGDIDVMRLVLSIGRSLAFIVSFESWEHFFIPRVTAHGTRNKYPNTSANHLMGCLVRLGPRGDGHLEHVAPAHECIV